MDERGHGEPHLLVTRPRPPMHGPHFSHTQSGCRTTYSLLLARPAGSCSSASRPIKERDMEPSNSARGRAAATFHALALRATRPKLSFRRVSVVLLVLVGCTSMGLTGLAAAAGRTSDEPPPVPECFYTGHDGYSDPTGPCGGMLIPGGGTVLVFTHTRQGRDLQVDRPGSLQTKHWVACGDAGCVYNELSWAIYASRGIRLRGPTSPPATCGSPRDGEERAGIWCASRQNTEPKILYTLWNGEPGGTISGYVP